MSSDLKRILMTSGLLVMAAIGLAFADVVATGVLEMHSNDFSAIASQFSERLHR